MNKKIFWIASYPKSGNTWLRAIISSLFFSNDGNFTFDLLKNISVFDLQLKYNFIKNLDINDYKNLGKIEILSKYRLLAQKKAEVGGDFAFFKTHSSNININNHPYTNKDLVRGVIYIIRDPRDVAISYSYHLNLSIDETIDIMTNQKYFVNYDSLPYLMSSWDLHYQSWNNLKVPKLIIKYEDMINHTSNKLNEIFLFLSNNFGFNFNKEVLFSNILKSTNFLALQNLEKERGFNEAKDHARFFRKGKTNQWTNILTEDQKKIIEKRFKKIMEKYDYL
tara:strand:- start:4 stop:840 length:837 start_codon:yes stop_codon:yes gene_type:complete